MWHFSSQEWQFLFLFLISSKWDILKYFLCNNNFQISDKITCFESTDKWKNNEFQNYSEILNMFFYCIYIFYLCLPLVQVTPLQTRTQNYFYSGRNGRSLRNKFFFYFTSNIRNNVVTWRQVNAISVDVILLIEGWHPCFEGCSIKYLDVKISRNQNKLK